MGKNLVVLLKYAFFIALAVLFVWLSTKDLDGAKWLQLKDALGHANYLLFIPVLLLLIISHWIRALRWRLLIQPMGYEPGKMNMFLAVMIGYFVNLGAPRLGEVVKCTVLARYEKVPADKLVGTIVAERAFDLICLMLAFGGAFIFEFDVISTLTVSKILPAFQDSSGEISYGRIATYAGLFALVLIVAKFLLDRLGHINVVQKLKLILGSVWQGIISVKDLKHKWLFIFQSLAIWVLYFLSTWLGFYALEATSSLDAGAAFTVLAMGSVGMIVSPGGIGAYAYLIQQTVELYNIPATPYGLALGWLLWFGQFMVFILCGVASFILLPLINKQKHEEPQHHSPENLSAS